MASPDENITVTARCLCKTHIFTTTVAKSSLPLIASLCHCDSCRHQTGAVYFGGVPWPNKDEDLSLLKRYSFSPRINLYSCGNCSSQIFCRSKIATGEALEVVTSALENTPGLVQYGSHIFVGDTIDGGASIWFRYGVDGRALKRWRERREESEELDLQWPPGKPGAVASNTESTDIPASPEFTPLQCHCKGVSLFLRSGVHLHQAEPGSPDALLIDRLREFGFETKEGRFKTTMDACDSCRMDVSSDITCWAVVPLACITTEADASVDTPFRTLYDIEDAFAKKDARLGTLTRYNSSPGVYRYFCSVCSASFFVINGQASDPGTIDVAVGVLHHPDGARAEGLLAWEYSEIGFATDGAGGWREELNRQALEGVQRWRSDVKST